MLVDGNSGNDSDRPGIEEQYLTAAATSNLRVGNDSNIRTPGDMIAAAGMNKHRMGLALLRLRTEWDGAEKPDAPDSKQIERMAAELTKVKEGENAGLVLVEVAGRVEFRLPLVLAAEMAQAQHDNKQRELMEGMGGLSGVRDGLVHWLGRTDGLHVVAAVLLWWLDPWCQTCMGSGVRVVAGSGGRSSGKPCGDCKGISANAGERRIPHGGQGKRVLSHINDCLRSAKVDLGEGVFRVMRSDKNERLRGA